MFLPVKAGISLFFTLYNTTPRRHFALDSQLVAEGQLRHGNTTSGRVGAVNTAHIRWAAEKRSKNDAKILLQTQAALCIKGTQ